MPLPVGLWQASSRAFNDGLTMPAVTVIIPVFNRAHIVERAIASVFAQDVPFDGWSINVVVVDDGSTDDLHEALRRFGGSVTCIRHGRNKGAAAARNSGVAAAEGEYIAFLDSDDTWLSGKLAAQIGFMEAHGHLASCTAYLLKRPNMPEILSPRYPTGLLGPSDIAWGCFVSPGSTLVCRRETFAEVGMYDEELRRLEDWDWLLRYTKLHLLGFLAQPLARIEVAPHAKATILFAALDRLEARYINALPPCERRNFAAALCIERAAVLYRGGHLFSSLMALVKSLYLQPFGNAALAAVLHNRLWRYRI